MKRDIYIYITNILRDVKCDEVLKNSCSFVIFRQTKTRRLYIIIKKSKKILQKQVGLYYHSIIVFDDELSRNSKQKSGLRCWKSLFKVRLNVPLIKKFLWKAVDISIGCVIIYLLNRTFVLRGLVFYFGKVRSGLCEFWSWEFEKKSSFFRLSESCLQLQTDIVCTQLWNKKPVLSCFITKRNWFWWSGFRFDLSEMQTENRCCLF